MPFQVVAQDFKSRWKSYLTLLSLLWLVFVGVNSLFLVFTEGLSGEFFLRICLWGVFFSFAVLAFRLLTWVTLKTCFVLIFKYPRRFIGGTGVFAFLLLLGVHGFKWHLDFFTPFQRELAPWFVILDLLCAVAIAFQASTKTERFSSTGRASVFLLAFNAVFLNIVTIANEVNAWGEILPLFYFVGFLDLLLLVTMKLPRASKVLPLVFLLPVLLVGCGGTPTSDLMPIIDTHAHIYPRSEEANEEYVDALVSVAQENGVSKILLGLNARHEPDRMPIFSSIHDDWVLAAAERYPDIIIPTLNGFDPSAEEAVDYVREQLETGLWKMIGELDLRNTPKKIAIAADDAVPMAIFALAGEYGVPVMIHYDFEYGTTSRSEGIAELETALDGNLDTTFIYAHTCSMDMVTLMKAHPNLYCEQERGPIAAGIDMSRVVLGTDIQVHENRPENAGEEYKKLIDELRAAISTWSDADQAQAATQTATDLFGL